MHAVPTPENGATRRETKFNPPQHPLWLPVQKQPRSFQLRPQSLSDVAHFEAVAFPARIPSAIYVTYITVFKTGFISGTGENWI